MARAQAHLEADVVIVGAGVAGLATAYHLALGSSLKILVLEEEKVLGGHASGRNAGMIRQTVSDPFLARMALLGRQALVRASKSGWKKIQFLSNGSLLLAKNGDLEEIKKIKKTTDRLGIPTQWLSQEQAAAKAPLLQGASFDRALFCPSDALLETKPLLESFFERLKSLKVQVLFSATPKKIRKAGNLFTIDLGNRTIVAKKIVNAAGAWCSLLSEKSGAQKIPLKPYRRHLYVTESLRMKHEQWPFVWDLSRDFYFRPEGKSLLVSPCDKDAVGLKFLKQKKEKTDAGMKKILIQKMNHYSKKMRNLKIKFGKSGLRTLVPDGRFVIGEDAKLPGFYWVAGLGGHGVTTCFSVGKLSSDIILGRKADEALKKAFSPSRFLKR